LFCRTKLGVKENVSEKDKNQEITYKLFKNFLKTMVWDGEFTEWE